MTLNLPEKIHLTQHSEHQVNPTCACNEQRNELDYPHGK